jgi:hypothetical protein
VGEGRAEGKFFPRPDLDQIFRFLGGH